MRPRYLAHESILIILLAALLVLPARAEISVDIGPSGLTDTIVMHIVDDPDPFGPLCWIPYRDVPTARILNPFGEGRGDEGPDIAWRAGNGWPVAVWAYRTGTDFDVAYSEWDGTEWSPVEFLTSSTSDEMDPRVFIEIDGTVHVAWWRSGSTDHVFLSTREAGSSEWSDPVQVTPESTGGRRPSVAVLEGILRVAYERGSEEPGMNQDVVVARREWDGSFGTEIVARTERTDRLDTVLHVENGRLWVDWKHAEDSIRYVESDGAGWTEPAVETWPDTSWLGVEDVRRTIRRHVLNN